jgi:hypothetical protein
VLAFRVMETAIPESTKQVSAACQRAISLAPSDWPPTLTPSNDLWGAPAWYPFEWEAWPIGESIRHAFVKNRRLRRPEIFRSVVQVTECPNLRRGRQSFVMALGFSEAREFAPRLVSLLDDPDVAGHVVHTLLKMKAAGYGPAVKPLIDCDTAWIRRLAKRYVKRYPDGNLG